MIKAVCFDLDGTLGRYTGEFGALAALLRSELDLHMCDMNSFGQLLDSELRRDGALSLAVVLERVLERLEQRPPSDLVGVAAAAVNAYAEDFRPFQGARELLERLDAAGIRLALVSNGPDDMQKAALHALGLARFFRVVLVSGDRDVAARKPAPRIFSLVCAGLQTVPEETLMVGDNLEADVAGALDYGLHAVLIDHAAGRVIDAAPEGVSVVGSLAELERLLRQEYRVLSPGPQGAE